MENKTIADKPLTTKQIARAERAEAIVHLKGDYLKAGDTVYAILRHVSKSGMSRWIDLYCINSQRQPLRITWSAAKALAARYDRRHEALRIDGCGFDVGHDAVHDLAWTLFGNSDALTYRWL
jgi:hypothetical protein